MFKLLDPRFACQDNNIKILLGTNSKVHTQLKDLLFKTCKPLGRTEIHYRKEGFSFDIQLVDVVISTQESRFALHIRQLKFLIENI